MGKLAFLVSLPRSLSTAFERSIIEQGELEVLHEPWCLYYYINLGYKIPAKFVPDFVDEFDKLQFFDHLLERSQKEKLFVKDFSYSLYPILKSKASCFSFNKSIVKFAFLFRDPFESIVSFRRKCSEAEQKTLDTLEQQINYEELYLTYCLCSELSNTKPFVIHAEMLKRHPEQTMRAYCEYIGITFTEKMLQWENKEYPQGWEVAKEWHEETMTSTRFNPAPSNVHEYFESLPKEEQQNLNKIIEKQRPFYEKLQKVVSCDFQDSMLSKDEKLPEQATSALAAMSP